MPLSPQEFQTILSRLKQNDPTLTSLDLGSNEIGAAGAKELSLALKGEF